MKRIWITEQQLKHIIKESALDREFHYTSLKSLISIVDENKFKLYDDEYWSKYSSFSMTRNRSNAQGFQYGEYGSDKENTLGEYWTPNYARIELDGKKLNNIRNVKIYPHDYMYNHYMEHNEPPYTGKDYHLSPNMKEKYNEKHALGPYRQFYSQAEDRLIMKDFEDIIPDAIKYITRIDIMIRDKDTPEYKKIISLLNKHPEYKKLCYFHTDNKTFNRPVAEKE